MLKTALLLLACICFQLAWSQNEVVKVIKLDEFVVSAGLDGFDVNEFIDRVRNDTTFYQSFLNLKYFPHKKDGVVVVFLKDDSEKGTMKRKAIQHLSTDEMMWVEVTFEETNGKIKNKKGEWRYLTAEMYDEVFFPSTPQKVSNQMVSFDQELVSGSKIEKHKAQLKRMMFNPGAEIENVPFIGDKLAIFDDHMVPYYDYALFMSSYRGEEVLAFSTFTKEGMAKHTVIQELTSYFDPNTHQVLAREYRLAHSTILFTFDISMKVENAIQSGWLLPQKINYNGYWNVPLRKPEIINFELRCSGYDTTVGKDSDKEGMR